MAVFSGSGHLPLSLQNTSSSLRSEAALPSPTRPAGTFPRRHGARGEAGPCEQPDARWGPFLRAGFCQSNQATESQRLGDLDHRPQSLGTEVGT